ncbi:MAG: alpha-2-macroglobulin family protein, partial [Acidobacteriota bacterium]
MRLDQRRWQSNQHFVLALRGDDLAFEPNGLYPHGEATPGTSTSALVYTDRSVYRPQQKILWKVVGYRGGGESSSYRTLPRTPVHVSLVDANGEQVAEKTVTTNGFGSASGEFEIPSGRLLGQWRLETSLGGQAWLRVEEYKRPTFEVTIAEPENSLRLNREAVLTGDVGYYFGLPVVTGSVGWRVTREPVYPRWWYWWRPVPQGGAQVVAAGETSLDEEGRFELRFTPEADEREARRGVTYRYRLGVDVTDEGGETRSASRVFRLGFVTVAASISEDLGFLTGGQPASLRILRTDLDGTPRAGRGAWRLVRLEQPPETLTPADQPLPPPPDDAYRTPGDELRPRWNPAYNPEAVMASWNEGGEIAHGAVEHGEDGWADFEIPAMGAGCYRIIYTTEDEYGATFETMKDLVVVGKRRTPLALPALLHFERGTVAVGETARLFVFTGFRAQEMVLEIYKGGRRVERRPVGAGRSGVVEFPITTADRGGFGVTLTVVRDFQVVRESARLFVPWDDRQLELEFATFRDRMRPGTRESFEVTVRGHDGAAVDAETAELLAYMYDRSLDIFAPHTPPSVLALYPDRTAIGGLWTSLGQAQQAWSYSGLGGLPGYPVLRGDRLAALDGYGIGGPGRRGGPRYMLKSAVMAEEATVGGRAANVPAPASLADTEADAASDELKRQEGTDQGAISGEGGGEAPVELRADFSETAFWEPHLLLAADGSATISFEVPDSVTEWNVWVHAVTTDLRGGSITRTTQSVKELMVRPYLPRFLREGDRAVLKVVVNNAGDEAFEGHLNLKITDPQTDEDLRAEFGLEANETSGVPFTVEAGEGADLTFDLDVPARVGTVAFAVTARAGAFSDGELRPLPVLPGRMHLMQSRFVTLHDADRREIYFADMAAGDDPTLINDQLVVTIDAQLFYSVLNALPYLVSYPYECTEQTLNRFLSTGIVGSLYDQYPAVEAMAEKLSSRSTRLETWEADDPNRKMALVETPWLQTARGGPEEADDLINVLDPRITRAQRDAALAKLKKSQTSLGAFPWWPGGPPSPYMTLYILYGFSKGLEFGVEAPKDVVVRGWDYMHRHYLDVMVDQMMGLDCCWETITFLNYVLSNYPDDSWTGGVFTDDDRARMLDFSFRHWREHSPLTKGYLALTLERAGRHDDAVLVFDAVMDSAKTDQDLGTYWAPEDRAWLWYNDTTETHAFALRTLSELE